MAEGSNDMTMDQQAGSSKTKLQAAEAWCESCFTKPAEFCRRHMAHGHTETKATRRDSEVSEANSVATPEPEHTAEATATPSTGAAVTTPAPVEQPTQNDEHEAATHEAAAETKMDKMLHSCRKHLSWSSHH